MDHVSKKFCNLFEIKYPIIQAGMVWTSGANLAIASAKSGIMGVLGAGSMDLETLEKHLIKIQKAHLSNIAVNIPLLYEKNQEQIDLCLKYKIKNFITSAGSPSKFTSYLKSKNTKVIHVVSNPSFAMKAETAGVDAVIAEGFEAGGHNGREEITTLCLIPQVLDVVSIPVIAAGGIATGKSILAMLNLGASAVQMGTRFLLTKESSAHENFKALLLNSSADSTMLMMKKYLPVRLYKNQFFKEIEKLEAKGASTEELKAHLGSGRARKGIFEGDLEQGELEIGQIVSLIKNIPSVQEVVINLMSQYQEALKNQISFDKN